MGYDDTEQKALAWDLRVIYANHLVGTKLVQIDEARDNNDYPKYFKLLQHLHILVKHKFPKDDEDEEKYLNQIKKIADIANKYRSSWLGDTQNSKECAEIEQALYNLEIFFYDRIDEANMFGAEYEDDGL